MSDLKCAITWATCCCTILTIAPSASADFVGVTTVLKIDPDIEFLCIKANGDFVPFPLTVCNVSAVFDNPDNILLSVGNAELQVYDGQNPDVFYQHPAGGNSPTAPACDDITAPPPFDFLDLICDSFITIGLKCGELNPADGTATDNEFDLGEFLLNGHIVGGWFNGNPSNGQGVASYYPDLQVLFLQASVALGLTVSGDIDLFWRDAYQGGGDTVAEFDVPIECDPGCPTDNPCDDGDPCTANDVCNNQACQGTPIDCDDSNVCTDDHCDPATGECVNQPNDDPCDDGDLCTQNDHCGEDGCVNGTPIECDDGNECTEDACDPNTGECIFVPLDCDDSNECTEDACDPKIGCTHAPIDCSDGNPCTDDLCDPDTGCTHEDIECPAGQVCDPASGECVEGQDPCECVNGKVTLCHIPQGNLDNAHTITVGCAARDRHLAHGDFCGPCQ